ncbi:FAD-dependent oxidoreductase [Streptomyces sp. NBC_01803]|uniref:FAD-dependent oxidoreductase n=1 Tax=Streptomyces sp. NBC_01803 TaxID=2975946 RepID=UPI002DD97E99|nr:FAD-dependent oxidoreductase [Streptomyces sp. NBC_01803]WSA45121.1 FAD-dependent oxidoreductase [Streptomyces sp. NBC_01803]
MTPDLLIIGGGPAGCAAAITAAGVGMRSVLIERKAVLCRKLYSIPALNNVLGGFQTGPDLAAAITADLAVNALCQIRTGLDVTAIAPGDEEVTVTLNDGTRLTAPYAVLATGVAPLQPADADWIEAPAGLRLPPLWEADPAEVKGRTWLIVGADRPLGTFLRAHPDLDVTLLVPHPATDAYKAEEVAADPRVTLLPTPRLTLTSALTAEPGGLRGDAAFTNIGSAPAPPPGVVRDVDGYCPPDLQHPGLIVAGDLRFAQYQRIMTASGSGAEAALRAYYTTRGVSGANSRPSSPARRPT